MQITNDGVYNKIVKCVNTAFKKQGVIQMKKEKITTREMQEIIKRTLEKKLRGYFEIQDETFISYETIHGQFFAINVISGDDVIVDRLLLFEFAI